MAKSSKGSSFEREVCKELSLWWTREDEEPRDDIFWRSSGSGARATSRFKRGKTTAGQNGDVCATDPIGDPFIKVLTLELKRGYQGHTIHNLLDRQTSAKIEEFEVFLQQAIQSYKASGSFSWALLHKRDRREAWIWFPIYVYKELLSHGAFHSDLKKPFPFICVECEVREVPISECEFVGFPFKDFLNGCNRSHFLKIHKEYCVP